MTLYDGFDGAALAVRLGLPRIELRDSTTSTMDDAHALAAQGAPSGSLVLANEQSAGRGRSGARWFGAPGSSVLCTLIERPATADALTVLSLRIGLGAARALDAAAGEHVRVKWPNDLYIASGKFAGILVEARWHDGQPTWVALAMGVNLAAPADVPGAAGLPEGVTRIDVLSAIVPAMRAAAAASGPLTESELAAWAARDWLAGRRVSAPLQGVARGILPTGELAIDTAEGRMALRSGTVTLEDS